MRTSGLPLRLTTTSPRPAAARGRPWMEKSSCLAAQAVGARDVWGRGRSTTSASRSLELVDAAAHDGEGLRRMRSGSPVAFALRQAEMSTAITTSAPIWRAKPHRHRRHQPSVDNSRVPILTGWNTAGTGAGGAHRQARIAALEQDGRARIEVGGDDAQQQRHLLDVAAAGVLAHELRQRLAADQPAPWEG